MIDYMSLMRKRAADSLIFWLACWWCNFFFPRFPGFLSGSYSFFLLQGCLALFKNLDIFLSISSINTRILTRTASTPKTKFKENSNPSIEWSPKNWTSTSGDTVLPVKICEEWSTAQVTFKRDQYGCNETWIQSSRSFRTNVWYLQPFI